jgi:di/tricarboxylate transporter
VILVFVASCAAWATGRWTDLSVAIAGLAGLAALGAVSEASLLKWLGHDTVWLIVGAFVISATLQRTGVAEALTIRGLTAVKTVRGLFIVTSAVVAATAFLIPSTSARAALCVPVFLSLAGAIPNPRVVRALALLFPTIILLSAGASLTGAAAHPIALELAAGANLGVEIGFLLWAALAAPPAIAICMAAALTVYWGFLQPGDRRDAIALTGLVAKPISPQGWRALALSLLSVCVWICAPLHGLSLGVTAIAAAVLMTLPGATGVSTKQAFKDVEWELILFMVAVLAMGEALAASGTLTWISNGLTETMRSVGAVYTGIATAIVIALSMAAHFIVTSRTARIAVVVPAIAFPAIAIGVDAATAVMAASLATGFCQSFTASAKPLAVFAAVDAPSYTAADLMKLSCALALPFALILWASAIVYWPLILGS